MHKALIVILSIIAITGIIFVWTIFEPENINIIILVIGTVLFFLGFSQLVEYHRVSGWVEDEATLTYLSETYAIVPMDAGISVKRYYPTARYEYMSAGSKYSGNKVSVEKQNVWITSEVSVWGVVTPKWWGKLEVGDKIPAFINPKNPAESLLIKDLSKVRRSHHLALVVSGILLGFIWAFIL